MTNSRKSCTFFKFADIGLRKAHKFENKRKNGKQENG